MAHSFSRLHPLSAGDGCAGGKTHALHDRPPPHRLRSQMSVARLRALCGIALAFTGGRDCANVIGAAFAKRIRLVTHGVALFFAICLMSAAIALALRGVFWVTLKRIVRWMPLPVMSGSLMSAQV